MGGSSVFGDDFGFTAQESLETQLVEENIIGSGPTSTVYRVRQDGVQVAVKRLAPELRLNPALIAAYRKEFEIGRSLKHDGLPVYRKLRADLKEVYIVEDFIDGINLEDFLATEEGKAYFHKKGSVDLFLRQLLGVVAYLHRSGVIHCDLKPANIMLRHSDRAVMVIDLDKAYCDTHDRTHGGTPGFSEPLHGAKPTAAKDFAAIACILEQIYGGEKKIPRKLRRFHDLCNKPGVSADELRDALRLTSQKFWTLTGLGAACIVVIMLGIVVFQNKEEPASESVEYLKIDKDTPDITESEANISSSDGGEEPAFSPIATEPKVNSPANLKSTGSEDKITDFDIRMADYSKMAETSLAYLRSGKVTTEEFQQMLTKLEALWSSNYNEILDDYRNSHPKATEAEVYQAVISASAESKAFRTMNDFNKELLDTINARNNAIRF